MVGVEFLNLSDLLILRVNPMATSIEAYYRI